MGHQIEKEEQRADGKKKKKGFHLSWPQTVTNRWWGEKKTKNNNSNRMGLTEEWRTFEVRKRIKGKRAPGTLGLTG